VFLGYFGHPVYQTEKGNISHPLNNAADQAHQDPKQNTKQLLEVFGVMQSAAALMGRTPPPDGPKVAAKAIREVTSADTEQEIGRFLSAKPSATTASYKEIVDANKANRGEKTLGVTWSSKEIDSSVTDPPTQQTEPSVPGAEGSCSH
jgi:hypothetical protein